MNTGIWWLKQQKKTEDQSNVRARRVSTPAGVSSGAKLTKFQVKSIDLIPESKTSVSE